MLAALPVGIVLLDYTGRVIETNATAQRVLGLCSTQLTLNELGRHVVDPVNGLPLTDAELPWRRALAGSPVHNRDLALLVPPPHSGRRLVTVSAEPFRDPVTGAGGALVMVFDRSELLMRSRRSVHLPPYLQRVLTLLRQGRSTQEIATELNLTLATTRLYIKRLCTRLGVHSRSQLVLRAIELGIDHPARNGTHN
jgi:DNA-binding CsgD family transcriptional regulator